MQGKPLPSLENCLGLYSGCVPVRCTGQQPQEALVTAAKMQPACRLAQRWHHEQGGERTNNYRHQRRVCQGCLPGAQHDKAEEGCEKGGRCPNCLSCTSTWSAWCCLELP